MYIYIYLSPQVLKRISSTLPFVDQIVIVTDSEEQRKLEEKVELDALPEEYGGLAKLTAFQDVLLPLAAPRMLTTNNNAQLLNFVRAFKH